MQDIQKELAELNEKIENAKKKIATFEGRKQELSRELKELFGTETIKEAQIKLNETIDELEQLEKEINKELRKLKENYGWE